MKRMSLQFVVRNMSSVVRSRDWKECLLDHPALMAEVMEAMARKESGEGYSKRTVGNFSLPEHKRPKNDGPVRNS